jgi:hypothetical protein
MATVIFSKETSSFEEWLSVNDDGSLTHYVRSCGWSAVRNGAKPRERVLSVAAAKRRWPEHAEDIEKVVEQHLPRCA